MKKTIALLGFVACAVGVSSLQATPDSTKPRHSTIYITSVTSLGSHIPLVVRAYDGSVLPISGVYVYGKTEIIDTGSNLDAASALAARDPAITFTRR